MTLPRVSVGLAVFNGGESLRASLGALLAQSLADFELIISDNASTDSTESIAREFAEKDRRIRYERNSYNIGLSANFNLVLSLARAPFFKWATADDICLPDFLTRCVEVLDQRPDVVLAYPRTQFIDEAGNALSIKDDSWHLDQESVEERLRFTIGVEQWVNSIAGVIRREALLRTHLLRSYPASDYGLLAELAVLGKFIEVPEVLYQRRIHSHSMSQNWAKEGWRRLYWGDRVATFMPKWYRAFDSLRTVGNTALPLRSKLSLYGEVLRFIRRQRKDLWKEITAGTRVLAHLPPRLA